MSDVVKIFSPATVANLSCGFDALGMALSAKGDTMVFNKTDKKGVVITRIEGADLSFDIDKNLVGVVAQKMLKDANVNFGLQIEIYKGFKPGSGLGSSAASAAGTAFGVNKILDDLFSVKELINYARLGEQAACGSPIADNVAAAICGGFVLIRSVEPLDVIQLPIPNDLYVTLLHPQIEIKTEDARHILPNQVDLKTAIKQWANVGGLVNALHTSDYKLLQRSLQDHIVEPVRKSLIPYFDDVKNVALEAGALGAGISGAGPTIFAISKSKELNDKVFKAMDKAYDNKNIKYTIFSSEISPNGVCVID